MSLSPTATLTLFDSMTSVLGQHQPSGLGTADGLSEGRPSQVSLDVHEAFRDLEEDFAEYSSGSQRHAELVECESTWRDMARRRLEGLAPEAFFAGSERITRPRVREYEAALKQEMLNWARGASPFSVSKSQAVKHDTKELPGTKTVPGKSLVSERARIKAAESEGFEALEALLRVLNGDLNARVGALEEECSKNGMQMGMRFVYGDVMKLLLGLAAQDWLPALVFNFSRGQCMDMARIVVEQLERAEEALKEVRGVCYG
jgi:hypothetical protein